MKLVLPSGPAHVAYCTNIHRGEHWTEVFAALRHYLPAVKRRICPDLPMGVGLRLSAIAAERLEQPEQLEALQAFLVREGLYVFTLNGFPYGPFHGQRVKEQVYAPDWSQPERSAYTARLSRLLARLLPAGEPALQGSVSTVPGAYRDAASRAGASDAIAEALIGHAAMLARLADETGREITLALEPEPMCLMETTAEAVGFFERHLFSRAAVSRFAALSGHGAARSEILLRRHLGLCLDVCHAAVEFEAAADSVSLLRGAGIAVSKLQLSSALSVPHVDRHAAELLRRFDDGVYLHQVVERRPDGLVRFLDLPEALAAFDRDGGAPREWRIHCHVPVFHEAPLDRLSTTQSTLRDMLALQREQGISAHLEVETYTWDVLPPELGLGALDEAIARELSWVRDRLAA